MTEVDFATFVRASTRSLYGTALVLTGSPDAAEELLQDTLARLYPKWERVAAAEAPLAYVRRALTNRYISGRRDPRSREIRVEVPFERPTGRDADASVVERDTVVRLLRTLPARQQVALVMRYLYDLPDEEIAASLDCRTATVRSLIHRGIAALREQRDARQPGPTAAEGGQR